MASTKLRPKRSVSFLFLLPALGFLLLFVVVPSMVGLGFSFTDWKGYGSFSWTGFENYLRVFRDQQTVSAFLNTFSLSIIVVVGQNVIGLFLALALVKPLKSRRVMQVLLLMPVIISPVIISYLWQYIFSPKGAINWALDALSLDYLHRPWLGDPTTALGAIAVVVIWQYSGYSMIIYLAGLKGIPDEVIEAAGLDGASTFQQLLRIKLPLLAPAITVNLVLSSITAMRLFDQVVAMTGGGPGYATETIASLIYKRGFASGEFAYGLAMAILLASLIAILSIVQTVLLRRRESDMR